jgi:transposase
MNPPKPTKTHLRYMMLTFYDIGHNVSSALCQINNTYGEKTVSDNTIRLWYKRFENGERSVEDLPRSGRKKKMSDKQLEEYLSKHEDIKLRQLGRKLNYSISTLSVRLKKLGVTNKKSTKIPYKLTAMN